MKNQVFSYLQMQYLKELGVDINLGSMGYYAMNGILPEWRNQLKGRDAIFEKYCPFIPTFTLYDAISYLNDNMKPHNVILLRKDDLWRVSEHYEDGHMECIGESDDMMDAVFNAIVNRKNILKNLPLLTRRERCENCKYFVDNQCHNVNLKPRITIDSLAECEDDNLFEEKK